MAVEKITAYRISAEDATAQAWASATKNAAEGINSIKDMIPGLATALSVAGFVELVRGSIDAMEHLDNLAKTTGLTVETLAGLKVAAKQSGGDLDSIASSIDKLSQNVGKAPDKFRELGISAKDPLKQFEQLADVFNSISDPSTRAAVAAEALGKSWQGAAPFLSEGSIKIAEMVDAGTKASGVTAEMAQQAHEFNDKLVLLQTTMGSTTTKIVSELLPGLQQIADKMQAAAKEGGGLYAVMVGFANLGKFALFGADPSAIANQTKYIADLEKQLNDAKGNLEWVQRATGTDLWGMKSAQEYSQQIDSITLGLKQAKAALEVMEAAKNKPETEKPHVANAAAKAANFLGLNAADLAEQQKLAHEIEAWNKHVEELQFAQITKTMEAGHARWVQEKKETEELIKLADELAKAEVEAADKQKMAADEVRQASINQGLSIADALRSTAELEAQSYDERLTNLNNYLDNSNLAFVEKSAIMLRFQQQHEANMGSISAQAAVERRKFAEMTMLQQASSIAGILESLTASTAQKNREMFELNKLASIANAIISTYEGANKALALGPWGIPLAGVIIAAGLANVANIASTQFGSGTSPSSAGGPSIAPPINVTPVGSDTGSAQTTIVQLQGDTFGRKQVQALLKQIADESKNGGRVVIG